LEAIEENLAIYDSLIERLALLAESARQDAVVLGALKGQLAAVRERRELMQALGVLPCDLGLVAQDIDLKAIAAKSLEIFQTHGLPRAVLDEFVEAMAAGMSWLPWQSAPAAMNGAAAGH